MAPENPKRPVPLRQLLSQAEKCVKELHTHLYFTYLIQLSDFRELSRPVRRKSQYPTLVTMQNALRNLQENDERAQDLLTKLEDYLTQLRGHAKRELVEHM